MRSLVFISERELLAGERLSNRAELSFFDAVDLSVWVRSRGGVWNDSAEAIGELGALRSRGKVIRLHASFAEGDLDGDLEGLGAEILRGVAKFGGCDLFHFNAERVWKGGRNINEKLATLAGVLRAGGVGAIGYSGHRYPPYFYGSGTEDLDPQITRATYNVLSFMAYNVKGGYDAAGQPWIARRLIEGRDTAKSIGLPYAPLIGTGRIGQAGVWGWVEVTTPILTDGAADGTVAGVGGYFAYGSRTGGQDTLWAGSPEHEPMASMMAELDYWQAPDEGDDVHLKDADDALKLAQMHLSHCRQSSAVRRASNATSNARAAVARVNRGGCEA